MIKTLLFFLFTGAISLGASLVTYELKWNYAALPIDVKLIRGPMSEATRVGENGTLKPDIKLPIQQIVTDGKIKLGDAEKAVLYIMVKNTGKKKLRFSVAPHSTEPAVSALGFHFNCLCNGHVYEVLPGDVWYRIMLLKTTTQSSDKPVVLSHDIFEVTADSKRAPQAHHHHN